MIKTTFTKDNGIYGLKDYPGYKTREESPFVIFKGDALWTIGHVGSRLSVGSIIPPGVSRKRADVIQFVDNMESANPEEVDIVATIGTTGVSPSQSLALRRLKRWAARL